MKFSDKLNGFYEEGYHYYIEIKDDYFSIRDYRRKLIFETTIHYDIQLVENNQKTPLIIDETVLSRDYAGEMMSCIKDLYYENGQIHMLYYYTILGETNYVLHKSDKGPFDHIKLRPDVLKDLDGKWNKYKSEEYIIIKDGTLSFHSFSDCQLEVCVIEKENNKLIVSPKDLTENNLGLYSVLTLMDNMLTGYVMVTDMDMPLSVFVKEGYENQVQIPEEADKEPRNTMSAMLIKS